MPVMPDWNFFYQHLETFPVRLLYIAVDTHHYNAINLDQLQSMKYPDSGCGVII